MLASRKKFFFIAGVVTLGLGLGRATRVLLTGSDDAASSQISELDFGSRVLVGSGAQRALRWVGTPALKGFASNCSVLLADGSPDNDEHSVVSAVRDAAELYDVHDELLFAVMYVESKCKAHAVSQRGAVGLMQIMPETARALGYANPHSVRANVFAGAKYLSQLIERFHGNIDLALAAYNAGPAVVQQYSSVPPYRETRDYVDRVKRIYAHLRFSHFRA